MGSNLAAQVVGGCPQGGILSPLLGNLVVDKFLVEDNGLGFNILGYADDIVNTVLSKFAHIVEALMQSSLNVVVKWAVKEGLKIRPHKTAIVPEIKPLFPLPVEGIRRSRTSYTSW
jgi:hypothetical protein